MYSMKERLDLISTKPVKRTASSNKCHSSALIGCIIICLVVLNVVLIGVLIYFAGKNNKNITCESTFSQKENITKAYISPTEVVTSTPSSNSDVRLPTSLKPIHYDIKLRPQLYNEPDIFTFSGEVNITIRSLLETDIITLHMLDLELLSSPIVTFELENDHLPKYKTHYLDEEMQFLIIEMTRIIGVAQTFTLHLTFKGHLSNDTIGFHKGFCNRGNETVSNRHLAFTLFQPTNARRAFPCFDEPELKATFNITLERKTGTDIITLTNMPLLNSQNLNDGYTEDIFQKSVPMSTYLVNFAFCNFLHAIKFSSNGTKVRVFSQSEHINMTNILLDLTVKMLEVFESYFNLEFSLPKLDNVVAPRYLPDGMEQWGLVTYRSNKVLLTKETMTTTQYEDLVNLVSHEVAHQWYGNLVSPSWWDDVWINEGFANFYAYIGIDLVFPDWKIMDLFVVKVKQHVMEEDGFETTNPVLRDVNTPDEIWGLFDAVTYDKAAAIVRMMRFFLGDETFKRGMEELLRKGQFGNVDHHDIFSTLANRAHRDGKYVDVESIMDTWIEQANYPVIIVTYNYTSGEITVQQKTFMFNCAKNQSRCKDSSLAWDIPFTYTTSSQPEFYPRSVDVEWIWKTEHSKKISVPNLPKSPKGWILGNIQGHGYYRVTYSEENWNSLIGQLLENHTVFHVVNRADLLNDAFALSRAGMLNPIIALNMTKYLKNENEYTPWRAVKSELKIIDDILEPTQAYGKFEAYMVHLIKDLFSSIDVVDIEGKNIQERFLAGLIFNLACKYLLQDCEDKSLELFREWKNQGTPIPQDVKETVTCTAVREGGEVEWNHMYHVYKTSPSEKSLALQAMGCTRRHWLQRRYLEFSLVKDKMDSQDMKYAVKSLASNPNGFHLTWNFILDHWKQIVFSYGLDSKALGSIISDVAEPMFTDRDYEKVLFWRNNLHPKDAVDLEGVFNKALSRIEVKRELFQTYFKIIDRWLDHQIQLLTV